jgi:adenine phosphoribosyltransferase
MSYNIPKYKDFPKPGVTFLNTIELCNNPRMFNDSVKWFEDQCEDAVDLFACDARGFIWGAPVAINKRLPFIAVRKSGKLPGPIYSQSYSLEYGEDTLEINQSVRTGDRPVIIVDDLLATGGTLEAVCKLLNENLGISYNNITVAVFVNLTFLNGQQKLEKLGVNVKSCINE